MLGGDQTGIPFRVFCWEEWKAKYRTSPPWGKKEFAQLHEARARIDTEQLAQEAWTKFMASTDSFHEGHSPGQFLYSLSKMTARAAQAATRMHRDGMRADPGYAERTKALQRIYAEVYKDDSIHEMDKRSECSRRFREEFPSQ